MSLTRLPKLAGLGLLAISTSSLFQELQNMESPDEIELKKNLETAMNLESKFILSLNDRASLNDLYAKCGDIYEKLKDKIKAIFCYEKSIDVLEKVEKSLDDMNLIKLAQSERFAALVYYSASTDAHEEDLAKITRETASELLSSAIFHYLEVKSPNLKQLDYRSQAFDAMARFSHNESQFEAVIDNLEQSTATLNQILELPELSAEEKDKFLRRLCTCYYNCILFGMKLSVSNERLNSYIGKGLEAVWMISNLTQDDEAHGRLCIDLIEIHKIEKNYGLKEKMRARIYGTNLFQSVEGVPVSQLNIHSASEQAAAEGVQSSVSPQNSR